MTATNMCSNFGSFRCRPPLMQSTYGGRLGREALKKKQAKKNMYLLQFSLSLSSLLRVLQMIPLQACLLNHMMALQLILDHEDKKSLAIIFCHNL